MEYIFIAIDGDNIGRKLEEYIVNEEFSKLFFFSNNLKQYFSKIKNIALKNHSNILLFGGDSVIIKIKEDNVSFFLEEIKALKTDITISIGIGKTLRQAYFALKEAKALGRNRIIIFKQ